MNSVWPTVLLALTACSGDPEPSLGGGGGGSGPEDDTGATESEEEVVSFTVRLGPEGLELEGEGCEDCVRFGIAEVGGGCESAEDGCWTGEDCVYGYVSPDDEEHFAPICHEWDGEELELDLTDDPDDLDDDDGETMVDESYAGRLGYYVEALSGACWTGGAGESWYGGLACTSGAITEQ